MSASPSARWTKKRPSAPTGFWKTWACWKANWGRTTAPEPRRAGEDIDENRGPPPARALVAEIRRRVSRPWVLMEICGGQTHTLMRYGIDELLPAAVELVHGP